ncbi:MAG: RNase P subunit p30 family protein [Candidatus Aenigmatarchaeota archaeon]
MTGFYDLHTNTNDTIGENSIEDMIAVAKRMGLSGLGVVRFDKVGKKVHSDEIDIVDCVMIRTEKVDELNRLIQKFRNDAEVIMVYGGDYDINRAACENSMVDVLCHPELGRSDSGFDHICARAAHGNNVAIEINFREVLELSGRHRASVIANMKKNVMLCNKFGTKMIATSSSISKWDIRTGRELVAILNLFGMDLGIAISSVSTVPENIAKVNREKLTGKRYEGATIVDDAHVFLHLASGSPEGETDG